MPKTIELRGVIGLDIESRYISRELSESGGDDILLLIDSPGGLVVDGFDIYNQLISYSGRVDVIISSASSIASYIAMAGDSRAVYENSIFMMHNARGGTYGDESELRRLATVLGRITGIVAQKYSDISGIPFQSVLKMMKKTTFMYGSEIIQSGFASSSIDGENGEDVDRDTSITNSLTAFDISQKRLNEYYSAADPNTIISSLSNFFTDVSSHSVPSGQNNFVPAGSSKNKQKNSEAKKMDKIELYEKHRAVYDEIFNAGVTNERERVCAHLELMKSEPATKAGLKFIQEGKSVSNQLVIATYMSSNFAIENRAVDDVESQADTTPITGQTEEKLLLNRVMAMSNHNGTPIFGEEK